jgi:hypothetical protein
VNNFSSLSLELLDELKDVLAKAPLDAAMRGETNGIVTTVASNLDKVVQHGRRADLIVKNMLLHSREGSGERTETNINAMVEERSISPITAPAPRSPASTSRSSRNSAPTPAKPISIPRKSRAFS